MATEISEVFHMALLCVCVCVCVCVCARVVMCSVEINEDRPNENRGYLFRACYNKEGSHHRLHLTETLGGSW